MRARSKPAPPAHPTIALGPAPKPETTVVDSQPLPPPVLTAEDVLERHKLKRTGSMYVLEEETAILDKLGETRKLYALLRSAHKNLVAFKAVVNSLDQLQMEREQHVLELRNHEAFMNTLPQKGNNEIIAYYQVALNVQARLKGVVNVDERDIAQLKKQIEIATRDDPTREFDDKRARFLQAAGNLRSRFERTMSRYERIRKDDQAIKAVQSIAKKSPGRVELGPTKELSEGFDELKTYQTTVSGERSP